VKRLILLLPLLPGLLAAREWIRFSGDASISAEQSFVAGDTIPRPVGDARLSLNPTLTLFGTIPIGLELLIGTQENNLRQAFDKYRIYLHPRELLQQMSNAPGLLLAIHGFELGYCNPSFSPLTLSGTPVLGGAAELNPGPVYIAAAVGRTQRAVEGTDTTQAAYARMLYGGRFGFGKKAGTHFYLTALKARDDPNSVTRNWMSRPGDSITPADTLETVTPRENYVLGAEFNLSLFQNHFSVTSEINGIELTRDSRAPGISLSPAPAWIESIVHPRYTSAFDYAYVVRPALNVLDTRIYGNVKMVGPGYQTLGVPTLRNDNLGYGAGIERSFANRSITVSGSFSRERDNLIGAKADTTVFTSYAANLGLNFPRLPYLQVNYSPTFQQTAGQNNRTDIVGVSTGYDFEAGGLTHSPGLAINVQKYQASSGEEGYTSLGVDPSYSLSFSIPLTISAGAGYNQTVRTDSTDRTIYLDVTPSYTLFGSWLHSLTLGGTFETNDNRFDIRYNSTFPVWKIASANVSAQEVIYRGADRNYSETRLIAGLARSW
jgi:hypothetical protein